MPNPLPNFTVYLALLCLLAQGCAARRAPLPPDYARPFIAHAGGMAGGLTLTNSKEAFENAYAAGARLLEADINWSSDSELVLVHDFEGSFAPLFQTKPWVCSLSEYRGLKMLRGLTQWAMSDLAAWAASKPDVFIVTDIKEKNLPALKKIARDYPDLRKRIIPQIYRPNEFEYWSVADLGFPHIILTLYNTEADDEEVLRFARSVKLFAVTMPVKRAAAGGLAQKLKKRGVFVYIHTVNDPEEFRSLKPLGVQGIYTDSLFPPCPGKTGPPAAPPAGLPADKQ